MGRDPKETKTPEERDSLLTRGIGETVICICETRVTLKSRRGQRLKLGFLMNRQLVLVPRLNVVKRGMAEVVCISTRQSKAGPAPVLVIQAHTDSVTYAACLPSTQNHETVHFQIYSAG